MFTHRPMPVIPLWYVNFEKKSILSQDIIGEKVLKLFQFHEFNYFPIILLFIISIRKPLFFPSSIMFYVYFNSSMVTFLVIV